MSYFFQRIIMSNGNKLFLKVIFPILTFVPIVIIIKNCNLIIKSLLQKIMITIKLTRYFLSYCK